MNLEQDKVLYANIIRVLQRQSTIILENHDQGIMIYDAISQAFMLATKTRELAIEWLLKYEHMHYHLLVVYDQGLATYIKEHYHLQDCLVCYQAVYCDNDPFVFKHHLDMKQATQHDLATVYKYYCRLSKEELIEIIDRGNLYLAYHDGYLVGFIGEHLEGSIGLLEVFKPYRHHGFGSELEKRMINVMLQKGVLPYCQVEIDNEASLSLQKKLGLSISHDKVYWLF